MQRIYIEDNIYWILSDDELQALQKISGSNQCFVCKKPCGSYKLCYRCNEMKKIIGEQS